MTDKMQPVQGVFTLKGKRKDNGQVEVITTKSNMVLRYGLRTIWRMFLSANHNAQFGSIGVGGDGTASVFTQDDLGDPFGQMPDHFVRAEVIDQGDSLAWAMLVKCIISQESLTTFGVAPEDIREFSMVTQYTEDGWLTYSPTRIWARVVTDEPLDTSTYVEFYVIWRFDFFIGGAP